MAKIITNFGNERFEGTSEEFRQVLKTKLAAPDQIKCKKCGEIDSTTYQDENNNIINPKCINCGLEENEDE